MPGRGLALGEDLVGGDEGRCAGRRSRRRRPGDVATAVVYLLSDDAEWVTGQVLGVDGGSTMR